MDTPLPPPVGTLLLRRGCELYTVVSDHGLLADSSFLYVELCRRPSYRVPISWPDPDWAIAPFVLFTIV